MDNNNFNELDLVEFNDNHILLLKEWLEKEYIKKWFQKPEDWMNEIRLRETDYAFIHHYIVLDGINPIGFCQYYKCVDADEEDYRAFPKIGTYSIDYLIGDENYLGKGIGKKIISLLKDLVFKLSDSKLIVVKPDKENIQSCKVLEKNGFNYDEVNMVYYINK